LLFSARRKDFRIDTFKSGGKGGQHQNKTDSGVRITHIDTGLSSESRSSRSQNDNRKLAFRKLVKKLTSHVIQQNCRDKIISNEIIRTYHLVDDRVKDHKSGFRQSYTAVEQDIGLMIEARRKSIKDNISSLKSLKG